MTDESIQQQQKLLNHINALLADPHPGLMTWNQAYSDAMRELVAATGGKIVPAGDDPLKEGLIRFTAGKEMPAEQWKRPGKPEWAHHLIVEFERSHAWQTIMELLGQLERRPSDYDDPYTVDILGEASVVTDD